MGYKQYCKDYKNIENYEKALADNFKGWNCHHRKGVDIPKEELKALGLYYNRPANELIFIKLSEHSSLHNKGEHNPMYGKKLSEETKNKISEAKKGQTLSEEAKKKIGEAAKGNKHALGCKHSEETKKKIGEAKKGMRFFNNGKINIRAKECPDGFVPGRIKKL